MFLFKLRNRLREQNLFSHRPAIVPSFKRRQIDLILPLSIVTEPMQIGVTFFLAMNLASIFILPMDKNVFTRWRTFCELYCEWKAELQRRIRHSLGRNFCKCSYRASFDMKQMCTWKMYWYRMICYTLRPLYGRIFYLCKITIDRILCTE